MNDRYYVIAGSRDQYEIFIRRKCQEDSQKTLSLSNFIYVRDDTVLKGVRNPRGFFIGTWRYHPHIRDILLTLSACFDSGMPDGIRKIMGEFFT